MTEGQISRRNILKWAARSAILAAIPPSLSACSGPSPDLQRISEMNTTQARELLREVGIKDQFATSSPEEMYYANNAFAENSRFNPKLWKVFYDAQGAQLALALNNDGEIVPLRQGSDGKFHTLSGLDISLVDFGKPTLIHDFTAIANGRNTRYGVIGYSNTPALQKLVDSNRDDVQNLVKSLFSHSLSPVNYFHLPSSGMPSQVFNPRDLAGEAYQVPPSSFPPANVRGSTFTKFDIATKQPTRCDFFISDAHIKKEAAIIGMPHLARLAGYMANEAYGVAISSYRVTHGLKKSALLSEAGSTGADWATMFQVAQNTPNAFFPQQQVNLIRQLSNLG